MKKEEKRRELGPIAEVIKVTGSGLPKDESGVK